LVIIIILILLLGLVFGLCYWSSKTVDNLSTDVTNKMHQEKASFIAIQYISPYVKDAAISSQDERFYSNSGIDVKGTVRAIYYSLFSPSRQGASTITEQLAKNIYYSGVDSFKTDIQTKILAVYITQKYPKDKILEWYLNVIYFGKGAYGIENAASTYFHKGAPNLDIGESAYLMGLINLPGYYENHPAQSLDEAKVILGTMVRNKNISQSAADNAFTVLGNELK
jgi:membrane peptidoglycan carboxypeptidase